MSNFVVKNGVSIGGSLKKAEGTITGSATLDLSTGNYFDYTPTQDTTFVFSNPPASGKAHAFALELTGVLIDNSYDLANAQPPAYGRFSVAAQESAPQGLFFKPDGTKMYVVGSTGDDINEYSLSTAWEISTASYVQNFSVSAQDTNPNGVFFKSDGLKMYVIGDSGDAVNEYSLTSAWDVSTASYVQNFSVATEETSPTGIFFKPDGTKMYVVGDDGNDINEYSLSSAWDISTASYVQNFSFSTQGEAGPSGVYFKDDGLRMYMVGIGTDAVYSYTLTSAWDISSASFDYPTEGYFDVSSQAVAPRDLFFKPDGAKVYVVSVGVVYEYDLSTAWEVSTASYVQSFSVASQEGDPDGLFFKPDGTKMYITGTIGDDVNEYSLSSAWDISTASYTQNFSVSTEETIPRGLSFKPDGTKMYIIGSSGDDVNEYSLSSAWDISTASYAQNFSVAAQESNPVGLFFKPDGSGFFISGLTGDDVNEYSLSTAWDISTSSYVQTFSVNAQESAPYGIFFGDNGTKMYITGTTSDAIWQYTTGTYGDVTFTYPASVKWPAGTPPAAPADGETDLLEFYTDDAGTTYYGVRLGDDMS